MASRREAILEGVLEAERLHLELGTAETLDEQGGRVDVFSAILARGGELLFRGLDGLLGVYLPARRPGILVTTERPLAIQRYTAAHELGHFTLRHRTMLDEEAILHRMPMTDTYDIREVAADAFAAAFLMPKWLVAYHAERQRWTAHDLVSPVIVYQLALRMGTSYEATSRTLFQHQMITRNTLQKLLGLTPKKIKQQLLAKGVLDTWSANVWLLSERDSGGTILGEAGDVFLLQLREHTASGYLWNAEDVLPAHFDTVSDERKIPGEHVGAAVDRVIVLRSGRSTLGSVDLVQLRPWVSTSTLAQLSFAYDLRGRETGLPRASRERLQAA